MERKTKILLVEDDASLGYLMADFLTSKGFEVSICINGPLGWSTFLSGSFQFAILDVMLPGMDGFELAKKIREKQPDIPIILVTARSMKEDKIKGFNLGIDDYLTKPVDEDELFCRIQAIKNRSDAKRVSKEAQIQLGNYQFDYFNQSLYFEGSCKRLTGRENEVIALLIKNSGQIVRRETILKSIWGTNDYFSGRSLDVYISKLRKYLQADPNVLIENISKVGFILQLKSE